MTTDTLAAPERPVRRWQQPRKTMDAIRRFWQWLRFGNVRADVRSIDGGAVSEVAYIGRFGRIVGYWAYGHFDPAMPYRDDA